MPTRSPLPSSSPKLSGCKLRLQDLSSNMCLPGFAFNAVAVQVLYKVHVSLARHLMPTCLKSPVSESVNVVSVFSCCQSDCELMVDQHHPFPVFQECNRVWLKVILVGAICKQKNVCLKFLPSFQQLVLDMFPAILAAWCQMASLCKASCNPSVVV